MKLLDVWKADNVMAKAPEIIATYNEFYKQVASNYTGYRPTATTGGAKFLSFEGAK